MSVVSDGPSSYYYGLIQSLVKEQEDLKAALEKRAVEVLAGISTIITVLVAVATVGLGGNEVALDGWELLAPIVALAFFTGAGIACLFVLIPRQYESIRYGDLLPIVAQDGSGYGKYWKNEDPDLAQAVKAKVAGASLRTARAAQLVNGKKARLLVAATWIAFGGVLAIGVSLLFVLA